MAVTFSKDNCVCGVKTETRNDEHVRGEEEIRLGVANQLARERRTEEESESVGIHGEG